MSCRHLSRLWWPRRTGILPDTRVSLQVTPERKYLSASICTALSKYSGQTIVCKDPKVRHSTLHFRCKKLRQYSEREWTRKSTVTVVSTTTADANRQGWPATSANARF